MAICEGLQPLSLIYDPVNAVAERFMEPWYQYTPIPRPENPEKRSALDYLFL